MADYEGARCIALKLPETIEGDATFDLNGKGFAWTYRQKIPGVPGRTRHPNVLAIRVADLEEKEALLASEPDVFFTDDHYRGFPAVLVRLAAITDDALEALLTDAWRIRATRAQRAQLAAGTTDATER
jgi:hypothetical protein